MLFRKMMTLPDASAGATFLEERSSALFFDDAEPAPGAVFPRSVTDGGLILASTADDEFIEHPMNSLQDYVGYWKLNETANNNRLDSGPHSMTLVPVKGTMNHTTGKFGNACIPSTVGAGLAYEDTSNFLKFTTEMSFSCWVKIPSGDAGTILGRGHINTPTPPNTGWRLAYNGVAFTFYVIDTGIGQVSQAPVSDELSTFVHVVAWRMQGLIGISVENQTPATAVRTMSNISYDSDNTFSLCHDGNQQDNVLDCTLDEVAVWGRVLSSEERDYLWNNGNGVEL